MTQTDEDFLWFFFPLVGWGIGLSAHYLHAVRWARRELQVRQSTIERWAPSRG
ncbi:2TM domain-containing protein [Geodermatophilus sp. SYSU D00703]